MDKTLAACGTRIDTGIEHCDLVEWPMLIRGFATLWGNIYAEINAAHTQPWGTRVPGSMYDYYFWTTTIIL
jgi:hypothetical protein